MPERTKPPTPSIDDLRNEQRTESVVLVGKAEMLERLHGMYSPKTLPTAERLLFPHLLKHAGTNVSVSRIPTIITAAVAAAWGNTGRNIRGEMAKYERLVDAMVDGDEQRARAKRLLVDSLNG